MEYVPSNFDLSEKASIKVTKNTLADSSFSYQNDFKDVKIITENERVEKAYNEDGIIRNAVDRLSDSVAGFYFTGNNLAIRYLSYRLTQMSIISGESWENLFSRCWHQYWKTGNCFLLKERGGTQAFRPLYKVKAYSLKNIRLISNKNLSHTIDNQFDVWKIESVPASFKVQDGQKETKLESDQALIIDPTLSSPNLLLPGRDIIHIAHKRPAGSNYGISIGVPALRQVLFLRNLEEVTLVMIKKNLIPITHHKVNGIGRHIKSEMLEAQRVHEEAGPDNLIITSAQHEISLHGGESLALRVSDYLKIFTTRAISAVSASPFELGFEKGGQSDAEGARELRSSKIETAKIDFISQLEMFLIWELLYEGGFNPYEREEDQVHLHFLGADLSMNIKKETHLADLYNKGVSDLFETRQAIPALTGKLPKMDYMYFALTEPAPSDGSSSSGTNMKKKKEYLQSEEDRKDIDRAKDLFITLIELNADYNQLEKMLKICSNISLRPLKQQIQSHLENFKDDIDAKEEALMLETKGIFNVH